MAGQVTSRPEPLVERRRDERPLSRTDASEGIEDVAIQFDAEPRGLREADLAVFRERFAFDRVEFRANLATVTHGQILGVGRVRV